MRDRYGQVLVLVEQNSMGHITLTPVSERRQREIARSNWYDGSYGVYIQNNSAIERFMLDFPRATWYNPWTERREINDGVRILIDSWIFRHMVGGQTD